MSQFLPSCQPGTCPPIPPWLACGVCGPPGWLPWWPPTSWGPPGLPPTGYLPPSLPPTGYQSTPPQPSGYQSTPPQPSGFQSQPPPAGFSPSSSSPNPFTRARGTMPRPRGTGQGATCPPAPNSGRLSNAGRADVRRRARRSASVRRRSGPSLVMSLIARGWCGQNEYLCEKKTPGGSSGFCCCPKGSSECVGGKIVLA